MRADIFFAALLRCLSAAPGPTSTARYVADHAARMPSASGRSARMAS